MASEPRGRRYSGEFKSDAVALVRWLYPDSLPFWQAHRAHSKVAGCRRLEPQLLGPPRGRKFGR